MLWPLSMCTEQLRMAHLTLGANGAATGRLLPARVLQRHGHRGSGGGQARRWAGEAWPLVLLL